MFLLPGFKNLILPLCNFNQRLKIDIQQHPVTSHSKKKPKAFPLSPYLTHLTVCLQIFLSPLVFLPSFIQSILSQPSASSPLFLLFLSIMFSSTSAQESVLMAAICISQPATSHANRQCCSCTNSTQKLRTLLYHSNI